MLSIKAIFITVLVVLGFTAIAQIESPKLVLCGSGEQVDYYVDKNTLKKVASYYRAWVKIAPRQYWEKVVTRERFELYSKAERVNLADAELKYKNFSHTTVLYEFDCAKDQYRELTIIDYDKSGRNLMSHTFDTSAWAFVPPRSIAAGIMDCTCSGK
jgi:hypothetical protein